MYQPLKGDQMSEEITVAIITTVVPAIAAIFSGLIAWFLKRNNRRRRDVELALEIAINDIQFLLEVEKVYGEEMQLFFDSSQRNSIRQRVRLERGYEWSGRYTPSRTRNLKIQNT